MNELFQPFFETNSSEPDETEITTTILYFSSEELATFRKLCKKGIKKEYGEEYQQRGNLSDFLLKILKERYENS